MKIAIASGKGGTGKSSVAINLSYLLLEDGIDVNLLDCDVEEPNCHLFLNNVIVFEKEIAAEVIIPKINSDLCTACRKCVEFCKFKSQTVFKISNRIEHIFLNQYWPCFQRKTGAFLSYLDSLLKRGRQHQHRNLQIFF
ncbi:MAG: P-loop NTPase, partial [Oligoflexia bacterium]|nr:P-loop NTPase [Oligoflexia bacterium]